MALDQSIVKWGKIRTISLATIVSILSSVFLVTTIATIFGQQIYSIDYVYSIVIPLLIAPFITGLFTKYIIKSHLLEIEMKSLINYDVVTGTTSKGTYHQNSLALYNLALRNHKGFSIIYMDIDSFSQIDTTFGLGSSEEVLSEIGDLLLTAKRGGDIVGRIGDHRFSITLPETDVVGAEVFANKIREKIEQIQVSINDKKFNITASFGVASKPNKTRVVLGTLYTRAETALIEAKKNGANSVVTFKKH